MSQAPLFATEGWGVWGPYLLGPDACWVNVYVAIPVVLHPFIHGNVRIS
jgi:hypothetical protein